jgi:spore coat polysaccharide biosynthesis protein SpsF (cytidylyltransferase family)
LNATTAVFLSVRDKATRLPGKVVHPICGRPAIEHLIDRVKQAHEPDMVVLTTSTHRGDDGLEAIAKKNGIRCFRGSEDDKLVRYRDAAFAHSVDFFAVVDGDDLFADSVFIDQIVGTWKKERGDYIIVDGLPLGATAFGVDRQALIKVIDRKAEDNTEVWGGYFTNFGGLQCRFLSPENSNFARPEWRMTLDYPEDLAFFCAVFDALYRPGQVFSFDEIVRFLNEHPEVAALNRDSQKKYEENLAKAAPVRFDS